MPRRLRIVHQLTSAIGNVQYYWLQLCLQTQRSKIKQRTTGRTYAGEDPRAATDRACQPDALALIGREPSDSEATQSIERAS